MSSQEKSTPPIAIAAYTATTLLLVAKVSGLAAPSWLAVFSPLLCYWAFLLGLVVAVVVYESFKSPKKPRSKR